MSSHRPQTPEEFQDWSDENTCGSFQSTTRTWYESNCNNLRVRVDEHAFFSSLPNTALAAATSYREERHADLFLLGKAPTSIDWSKKSYDSFVEKLLRLNCIDNRNFPSPPADGWVTLEDSFEKVNDIVRATLLTAHADGPDFLAARIRTEAIDRNLTLEPRYHTDEKGYYACHAYIRLAVPIPSLASTRSYRDRQVAIELQITSALQYTLREVTHPIYERERLRGDLSADWKRDLKSVRFRAAYMAHSLRLIEAMILDLREQTRENEEGESK